MTSKARTMALGGVFTALSLLALFAISYMPNSRLFFYAASSLFISFMVVEAGIGAGWVFYLATSILSLLLIPNKLLVIPYAGFFGIYGLAKYYIESIKKPVVEYLLKGIFFIICISGLYLLFTNALLIDFASQIPIYYLLALLIILFYIYDYLYTRFLSFYINNFRKKRH
ncbi:MAG TPA: hypothetical protein VFD33_03665 [Bacillota bacterium]|nr:hypothetical protein [Bacillota bacterium]